MIEMKFNPWDEVIKIVRERWPQVKAEIYFTDTEYEWNNFPSGTVWYPKGSEIALIRISYKLPFMDTVEILAQSLATLAFNLETGKTPEILFDEHVEEYFNWIYDEYMRRIGERDARINEAINREENNHEVDGDNSASKHDRFSV